MLGLGRVRGERAGGKRQTHSSSVSVLMKKKNIKSEMVADSTGRLS